MATSTSRSFSNQEIQSKLLSVFRKSVMGEEALKAPYKIIKGNMGAELNRVSFYPLAKAQPSSVAEELGIPGQEAGPKRG